MAFVVDTFGERVTQLKVRLKFLGLRLAKLKVFWKPKKNKNTEFPGDVLTFFV